MKKKYVLLVAAIMVISMALVGCGEREKEVTQEPNTEVEENIDDEETTPEGKEGGVITFGIGSDPAVMNPLYADDRVTLTITNSLFDYFYTIVDGEARYVLAESMEPSEDFLTYTMKLREDVKWHDGQAFTADDVIFTFDSILDESQVAKFRGSLTFGDTPITVTKIDDYTVEFKLPEISVPFFNTIAGIKPIPKHIFEGEADIAKSSKNNTPVGTGPFKYKDMRSGEILELERNEDYFGDIAHLDGIVYRVIADPDSAMIALEDGEISTRYITAKDYEKFNSSEKFDTYLFSEGMVTNMVFRFNNEHLKDKRVRQAIAYGINKSEVIQGVYGSEEFASPAYSPLAASTLFHTDDLEKYDYNVEKAKELLKEANAENIKLRLMYTSGNEDQHKQALIMEQQLREIGIELEILPTERGAFLDKFLDPTNTDFDLAYNGYVMGIEPDGYKALFMSGNSNNIMLYENEELDNLFNMGMIEKDEGKRKTLYEKAQKIIIDDMVLYPIAYPKSIVATNSKYKGIDEAETAPIFMFRNMNKIYIQE